MRRYAATTGKYFATGMMLLYLMILAIGVGAIVLAVCGPECRGGTAEKLIRSGQELMERYLPEAMAPAAKPAMAAAAAPAPVAAPVPVVAPAPLPEPQEEVWEIRTVRATAYNAHPSQTDDTPEICAWGDRVRPGIIAVSRDLEALGLGRGREVYVEGYGKLTVLDRMHRRKRNQIDIFMEHHHDAIKFGVQEVVIKWRPETDEQNT